MPVFAKILMNNNSILPLADGTRGKFMVDHASQSLALEGKRDCGRDTTIRIYKPAGEIALRIPAGAAERGQAASP
jgi:hypothetical protein